jgi:serine/threonine protein kinase
MARISTQAEKLGWKFLGKNLGRGGQGDVDLVERVSEPGLGKYAFKYLGERGGSNAHERFRQELQALTSLHHPNIVKVVEYAKHDDSLQYYVMEYIEGARSLRHRMNQKTNPFFREPLKAVDGFIQLVGALAECAKFGIVHRDLSPANVLVTDDARIMLIDFGLCHIDQGNRVTVTDEAVGMPHYRPPECTGYSSVPINIRSDFYSAGKILWSMLTNKLAFDREKPVFNELSLVNVLADVKMAWHFYHIFEGTIRHNPNNRFANAASALDQANMVRRLIVGEYQSLEQIAETVCPICGIGNYKSLYLHVQQFPEVIEFHKVMEPVKGYAICPYCFHVAFIAIAAQQKKLADRKELD